MKKLLDELKKGLLVCVTADITLALVLTLLVTSGITNHVMTLIAGCLFCSSLGTLLIGKLIKDGRKESEENEENKD